MNFGPQRSASTSLSVTIPSSSVGTVANSAPYTVNAWMAPR